MQKLSGPAAEEYRRLTREVRKLLSQSDFSVHVTNLGLFLSLHGVIKNPRTLYSNIEDDIIRAIINAKLREK